MRRLAFIVPLALTALVVALLGRGLWRDEGAGYRPTVMIGMQAPALKLPAIWPGRPALRLGEPEQEIVAVNFFASWCVPCRAEHPVLLRLAKSKGVRLVGVAYKDTAQSAQAFLGELGDPFSAAGLDQDGKAAIAFGITGVPETFFLDRQGVIRHHVAGPLTQDALEGDVARAIADMK
jgi:cytochrome c biogenesis protein CcmG/thiol:disulfide interchange protein DsbE